MDGETFEAEVRGGTLVGKVAGAGTPVLLLHGGPGLGYGYLGDLAAELVDGYRVAWFQQRGLDPSTAREPYDVAGQADDVAAVLDGLGWDRAVVIGHSWGGHLLLHVVAAHPNRLLAAVVVDPLGGVGDGGETAFEAEMLARTPAQDVARAAEAGRPRHGGRGHRPRTRWSRCAWSGPRTSPTPRTRLRCLRPRCRWRPSPRRGPTCTRRCRRSPTASPAPACLRVFVHGGASPMPLAASTDTAAAMGPNATVVVVPDTGHFIWHESPGAVRRAVDDVLAR